MPLQRSVLSWGAGSQRQINEASRGLIRRKDHNQVQFGAASRVSPKVAHGKRASVASNVDAYMDYPTTLPTTTKHSA
jgi:hypothetical protein